MAKRRFRWRRYYLANGIVLSFALIFFFSSIFRENDFASRLSHWVQKYGTDKILDYIVLPLNQNFTRIISYWNNPLHDMGIEELQKQVVNLKRQLEVKDHLIQELNQYQDENQYLRSLLGYRSNINHSVIPAEIVSYQPQNHFYSFWIGVGRDQSIADKMPVIAFNSEGKEGLVGFVSEAHKSASLIQSILDPQTHVGVTIEGYDSKAILKGDIDLKGFLYMDFINKEFTNLMGKSVQTSGIGQRYPSGLEIGNINSTTSSLYGLFQSARVKPNIDFTSLKEVFVIVPSQSQ